jgi:alanyl-tRNA synthetase
MFPLVPFLQGESHPSGTRLVNSQRCVRTIDIEGVGDAYHCTTFEMLGNWSLNNYFKKEAISMTLKFFVEELGFDINKIYATVFEGNESVPKDTISIGIWKELFQSYGINAEVGERIMEKGKDDNWWELATGGPCGPDSEIFYEVNNQLVEIGNNVFMEYLKAGNEYKPLGKHNVDFGGGLDRLAAICQGVSSVYETDIYKPIFDTVKALSRNNILESQRIITDHIKAATWIIMDGVEPSKTEQGYILTRLIRRAVRHGKKMNIEGLFTRKVGEIAINQFSSIWNKLEANRERILNTLEEEEKKFGKTLENGLREMDKLITSGSNLPQKAFKLYETYGFPIELTIEELKNKGIEFNEVMLLEGFKEEQKKHQELSRTASAGLFKED